MAEAKSWSDRLNLKSIHVNSRWIYHYDGSGCGACGSEFLACLAPAWDIERLGVRNTGHPAYADILLITGLIEEKNEKELLEIYEQMPEGRRVIAAGPCACTGGVFSECSKVRPGAASVIPVDLYIAGCPVRPESLIDALVKLQRDDEDQRKKERQDAKKERQDARKERQDARKAKRAEEKARREERSDQPEKPTDQPEKPADQQEKPADQPKEPADQQEKPADQQEKPTDQPKEPTATEADREASGKSSGEAGDEQQDV